MKTRKGEREDEKDWQSYRPDVNFFHQAQRSPLFLYVGV